MTEAITSKRRNGLIVRCHNCRYRAIRCHDFETIERLYNGMGVLQSTG